MAEAVDRRIEPHSANLWTDVALYRLQITTAGTAVASFTRTNGPAPATSPSGEAVIVLDWPRRPTHLRQSVDGGRRAGRRQCALIERRRESRIPEHRGVATFPLHLIGHSRGAIDWFPSWRVLGQSGISSIR